jgi:hypothetical protein
VQLLRAAGQAARAWPSTRAFCPGTNTLTACHHFHPRTLRAWPPLFSHCAPRRVADTLEPMDKSRKAFQLINSVLVERTVEEVLPIVRENRDGILQVKVNIEERLNKLVAEIREFSARYNGARTKVHLRDVHRRKRALAAAHPLPPPLDTHTHTARARPRSEGAQARGGRGHAGEGCQGGCGPKIVLPCTRPFTSDPLRPPLPRRA